ncbi:MAG: hypothetical protein NT015_02270 [Alphaproteobacteria bacterium]|nr:hypothetical protein [Alphaproteobacteria bacterium]
MTGEKPPYHPEVEDALIEQIVEAFLERFSAANIASADILPQIDVGFRAYIFFRLDADAAACREGQLCEQMRAYLVKCLLPLDGDEADLLALELDSHESVVREFGGNYFLRMRSGEVQERGSRKLG